MIGYQSIFLICQVLGIQDVSDQKKFKRSRLAKRASYQSRRRFQFGLNSYLGNEDGFKDLLVIKSDQLLENWWYGKSGNNPNGEKADIISELDNFDQIKILGAASEDLSVSSVSVHNLSGLGIYASGFLEAVYIGTNVSAEQLSTMITGDASPAVMNNSQGFYGL